MLPARAINARGEDGGEGGGEGGTSILSGSKSVRYDCIGGSCPGDRRQSLTQLGDTQLILMGGGIPNSHCGRPNRSNCARFTLGSTKHNKGHGLNGTVGKTLAPCRVSCVCMTSRCVFAKFVEGTMKMGLTAANIGLSK
jgi:hypothetical protein